MYVCTQSQLLLLDVDTDGCSICYTFPSRITSMVEFGTGLKDLLSVNTQRDQCG